MLSDTCAAFRFMMVSPMYRRRVEQRLGDPALAQQVVVVAEQQLDHQPDHLTRGEVLTGCLVGSSENRLISSSYR